MNTSGILPVKVILFVIGALIVVGGLATGTLFLLKAVKPEQIITKTSGSETPTQPTTSSKEGADKAKDDGINAETNGDTQKALDSYKAALAQYEKAGDKTAAEDMKAKITAMEEALEREKQLKAEAEANPDE